MEYPKFYITGQVINAQTQEGIYNLKVEAWDQDEKYHDLVGVALTDRNGYFDISFDLTYFREFAPEEAPDLFFKVFRGKKLLKDTRDEVIWNAEQETRVTIEIDIPAEEPTGKDRVGREQVFKYANFIAKSDFKSYFRQTQSRARNTSNFARDMIVNTLTKMDLNPVQVRGPAEEEIVNQDVEVARQNLESRNVKVNKVEQYDPKLNRAAMKDISKLSVNPKEGQTVNLYQDKGKVRYYSVVDTSKEQSDVDMAQKVDKQEQEISQLRQEVTKARESEAKKEKQIDELMKRIDSLNQEQMKLRNMVEKGGSNKDSNKDG